MHSLGSGNLIVNVNELYILFFSVLFQSWSTNCTNCTFYIFVLFFQSGDSSSGNTSFYDVHIMKVIFIFATKHVTSFLSSFINVWNCDSPLDLQSRIISGKLDWSYSNVKHKEKASSEAFNSQVWAIRDASANPSQSEDIIQLTWSLSNNQRSVFYFLLRFPILQKYKNCHEIWVLAATAFLELYTKLDKEIFLSAFTKHLLTVC